MHVKFVPDPYKGLDARTMWQIKKIPLIAGSEVKLNFKSNKALETHLGLCGECLCRSCECAGPAVSANRGKHARDARAAYAARVQKRLAK